jgi:alpha-beta hydrolase superfamily lysophospholipase
MKKISFKERIFFSLVCNEQRVYHHWYSRFLLAQVDIDRIRRVIKRIRNWFHWLEEWSNEGAYLNAKAETAFSEGNILTARNLLHEAAGCYHIGQHFFYFDEEKKNQAMQEIWRLYKRAISLYKSTEQPKRVEIRFRNTVIPGYLKLQKEKNKPLIILINGMDNIKEIEQHYWANLFVEAGFNTFVFDGPGQGEMHNSMNMIPDYEKSVIQIINWFETNSHEEIEMNQIATVGFSMGGYFSPLVAAHDNRVKCAVSNGGPATLSLIPTGMRANPFLKACFPYATGRKTYKEALEYLDYDIRKAPPLECPLLLFHSGKDRILPDGKRHAEIFMDWAQGEKEFVYYPDGEHVCANYLDEVTPKTIDWLLKHFNM